MAISNKAVFLSFVRVLVDETTEEAPLTKREIMDKCEAMGCSISENTFDNFIKNMAEAGIVIRKRLPPNKDRGTLLYWYAEGWI